jgi:hypothetical protein
VDIKRVEFTLEKSEIVNSRINVQKLRGIFLSAGKDHEFTVHTDDGDKITYIREDGRQVDHFHLGTWFGKRSGPELIGKLAIEVVKPMEEYTLKIISI